MNMKSTNHDIIDSTYSTNVTSTNRFNWNASEVLVDKKLTYFANSTSIIWCTHLPNILISRSYILICFFFLKQGLARYAAVTGQQRKQMR